MLERLRYGLAGCLAMLCIASLERSADAGKPKIAVLIPKPSALTQDLAASLESTLQDGLVDVVSPKKVKAAAKKLKTKASDPKELVKLTRNLRADYTLVLSVDKKGKKYSARARMVSSEKAEYLMDFKSAFSKPKTEAKDRGKRIAAKVLEKLSTPPGADAEPPPPQEPEEPEAREPITPDEPPEPESAEPEPEPAPEAAEPKMPVEPEPMPEERKPVAKEEEERPAPPPAPTEVAPKPEDTVVPKDEHATAPEPEAEHPLLTLAIGAGSGLLHKHSITSPSTGDSRLSYSLSPLTLLTGEFALAIPGTSAGLSARIGFSPVRFNVNIEALSESPAGIAVQLAFALNSYLDFSRDFGLIASAGIRFESLSVQANSANVVVGSRVTVPYASLAIRWALAEDFDLISGGELGITATHEQAPVTDGQLSGGMDFAVFAQGRSWMSSGFGLTFETRFDRVVAKLSGRGSRQAPAGEILEDVSLGTTDLRLSAGIIFRL